MYDTWEYANSRLHSTIVRKAGVPIYVKEVGPNMSVRYTPLCSEDNKDKFCKVKDLCIEPVPLGFCNTPVGATYLSRQPRRDDWRQGLRDISINKQPHIAWNIQHANILEAINGVSKPLKEAMSESAARKGVMVAFHRYWAVQDTALYHKWFKVGVINSDGRPEFTSRYEYLESRFVEDCGYGSH